MAPTSLSSSLAANVSVAASSVAANSTVAAMPVAFDHQVPVLDTAAKAALPRQAKAEHVEHIVIHESTNATNATSRTSHHLVARTTDIADVAVNAHNAVRARHGAQPLRWNSDLANYAQQVASACRLAHNADVGAETGKYGQSIASWGTSGVETRSIPELVRDGVEQQWYHGEIAKFPGYGQPTPDMTHFHDWGHYSQTVWASTSDVGCAIEACPANTVIPGMTAHIMYCNYRTPGNVPGKYGDNVKPASV